MIEADQCFYWQKLYKATYELHAHLIIYKMCIKVSIKKDTYKSGV
jgi:hypothetical protein